MPKYDIITLKGLSMLPILDMNVYGIPRTKGSLLNGRDTRLSKEWRAHLSATARRSARFPVEVAGPVAGPVRVAIDVRIPVVKRELARGVWNNVKIHNIPVVGKKAGDGDKYARNVLDALSGIIYIDDCQVEIDGVHRSYSLPSDAGMRVAVWVACAVCGRHDGWLAPAEATWTTLSGFEGPVFVCAIGCEPKGAE